MTQERSIPFGNDKDVPWVVNPESIYPFGDDENAPWLVAVTVHDIFHF